jgi:formiminoglutamase
MTRNNNFTHPVIVKRPAEASETPFVASFPHSGTFIPSELRSLYTQDHLARLRNTDWHLPDLYNFLPDLGVTSVAATFSRYVIDVNRGLGQRRGGKSYRSSLIYRRDTWGERMLKDPECDMREEFRIAAFYNPFHEALERVITDKIKKFGKAYLIDCHSYPVQPVPKQLRDRGYIADTAADIYLGAGDLSEKGPYLKAMLHRDFKRTGFTPGETPIFPGGYIVRYYGEMQNVEACMVELKYMTYMADNSANGDHMPPLDLRRASFTKARLKKALTATVNAYNSSSYNQARRLTL